jgi:hypothetical protein
MGGHHTAALGHAGHLGLLYIITLGQGRLGDDLRCGHYALTADSGNQDIGGVIVTHDKTHLGYQLVSI